MHGARGVMEPLENNDAENADASRWAELKPRVISGAVMAALLLAVLWLGGWAFTLLILVAAMLMVKEWNDLTSQDGPGWRIAGLFYAAIPCASLIWLRELRVENYFDAGLWLVLYLMFVVWATDIGAYFTGRKIGGPKLAPMISPGKTWAGLAGGIFCAGVVGGLCHSFSPFPATLGMSVLLAMLLAIVAQAGDLFESWLKRRVGAKDSGTLIPGHGGLLDRVDGLVFTAPLFAWSVYLAAHLV
jgi:phosphatidate cytidylyltransferase